MPCYRGPKGIEDCIYFYKHQLYKHYFLPLSHAELETINDTIRMKLLINYVENYCQLVPLLLTKCE